MKLECIEDPGPHRTSKVRECDPASNVPFGIVVMHTDRTCRVYHTGCGLWAFEGEKYQCQTFLGVIMNKPDLQWDNPHKYGSAEYECLEDARTTANLL